jgi:hypothetical protein
MADGYSTAFQPINSPARRASATTSPTLLSSVQSKRNIAGVLEKIAMLPEIKFGVVWMIRKLVMILNLLLVSEYKC